MATPPVSPSLAPTQSPTVAPSISLTPSFCPSVSPTLTPSAVPTFTPQPTVKPSISIRPTNPGLSATPISIDPSAIAGIVIGGIIAIALLLIVPYFYCRLIQRPRKMHLQPRTVYWQVDKDGHPLPEVTNLADISTMAENPVGIDSEDVNGSPRLPPQIRLSPQLSPSPRKFLHQMGSW